MKRFLEICENIFGIWLLTDAIRLMPCVSLKKKTDYFKFKRELESVNDEQVGLVYISNVALKSPSQTLRSNQAVLRIKTGRITSEKEICHRSLLKMRQQDVKFLKCSVNILSNDLYKLAFRWVGQQIG